MLLPPVSGSIVPHSMVVHIWAAIGGTHSADHAWYIFRRLRLVHIRAIMPGTHSGGFRWYILARSMTMTMNNNYETNKVDPKNPAELSSLENYSEEIDLLIDKLNLEPRTVQAIMLKHQTMLRFCMESDGITIQGEWWI